MNKRTVVTTTRKKIKINPYLSGHAEKNMFDTNYGLHIERGPLNLDVNQSVGTGYRPETEFTLGINIPITRRVKHRNK
jgi:hypothetical protein